MLQQFLGLANQIREYVPNLANIINKLTKKVSSKVLQDWTDKNTNCVIWIKNLTKNLKSLSFPEDSDSLIIESDAFDLYWGGNLKAKETNSIKRMVPYA